MPVASIAGLDFEKLFTQLPERYIILKTDDPDFTIAAVSDTYLNVTTRKRHDIIGLPLLEVFPDITDRSDNENISAENHIVASFRRCITTKKPDNFGIHQYDILTAAGVHETRYWQLYSYPYLSADKKHVEYIIHSVYDVTETFLADDKLKLTQFQLDEALSAGLIGTWLWNIHEDKIIADSGLAAIFGVDPVAAAEGLPLDLLLESIHDDDRERVVEEIYRTVESGTTYECEYRLLSSDHKERWVIARGRVERNADGTAMAFPGVIVDISARKKAEKALADSENRLRFMADSMPQLVWVMDGDGEPEFFNKQWYQYTCVDPDEAEKSGWKDVIHPDDVPSMRKAWKHSLKTGEPYNVEYRILNARTRTYRWFVARALPLKNPDGTISKWYGTCTDIDEQKRTVQIQAFLSETSKELSASLDYQTTLNNVTRLCIPEIADWCTVDLYDKETGWEQVALAHTDPEKISLAMKYRELNPIDINDEGGVAEVIRTGQSQFYPVISDEMITASIDDEERREFMRSLNMCSIIVAPIKIQDKTVGAISLVSSDSGRYYTQADYDMAKELANRISLTMTNAHLYEEAQKEIKQRKKLEKNLRIEKEKLESRVAERTQQLHEYSESLSRSNQELQDFAYVASHDLQEPLRKIQAFGTLLANEYDESLGEGKDYLDRMRNAASRMSILIEDLLSFSRVTTKARPDTEVNLEDVVKNVLSDLETRIQDTHGHIEIKSLPTVSADPTQMRQLFQNLIGNALKFHREGIAPHITITAEKAGNNSNFHTISITDNGIGFDEKYLDRIFAVFQRLHGRDTYEGTGIGLAVCKKIVERYGGTIEATSKKNQGATFTFTLPKRNQGDQ
jgi:PAS domain S-box-containing protein